jgi:predicted  nucleic acid-binding Zn-ribbon protein
VREQWNAYQAEQTFRLNKEAKEAAEKADRVKNDAAADMMAAVTTKLQAEKTVADATKKITDVNNQLGEAKAKLDILKGDLQFRDLITSAEGFTREGNHDAALG